MSKVENTEKVIPVSFRDPGEEPLKKDSSENLG
jgi:hypothetical protein